MRPWVFRSPWLCAPSGVLVGGRAEVLIALDYGRRLGRLEAELHLVLLQHVLRELRFDALARLDIGDPARGEIGRDPYLAAVGIDFLAHFGELLVGVLDFLEVVLVRLLVELELLLVLREVALRLLELQRELAGGLAIARLEVGFHLGLQLVDLGLAHGRLSHDALDQPAIELQAFAAFLELLDGAVVFEPHDGDGVALPQGVGDAVEERANYGDELLENHVAVLVMEWLRRPIYIRTGALQPRGEPPSPWPVAHP